MPIAAIYIIFVIGILQKILLRGCQRKQKTPSFWDSITLNWDDS
jgi:hypothetical protein